MEKTWEQYHSDISRLAELVMKFNPEVIAPCMKGGLIAGAIIAEELGINDIRPIDIEREGDERRLVYDVQGDIAGKRVLLVEDDLPTGKGPAMVKQMYIERGADAKIASIYVTELSRKVVDFFVEMYEGSIEYPWKEFNKGDRLRDG